MTIEPPKVLVTGASGFIGRHLVRYLMQIGYVVRAACRRVPDNAQVGAEWSVIGEVDGDTDWTVALKGVTHVVHLAGVAHRVGEDERELAPLYERVNKAGTRRLADAVATTGVRRLVFVSSAKAAPAEGESAPDTAYGRSKLQAEDAIAQVLRDTACDWCVLRPVLVYGPGNTGNMARLVRLIRTGLPLPLGAIHNQRSMLYVDNLVNLIERALHDPRASRGRFFVCDSQPLSTPELVRLLGQAEGRRVHLWPMPVPLLQMIARAGDAVRAITGRSIGWESYSVDRLCGSLVFSNDALRNRLGWEPPFTTAEGLRRTIRAGVSTQ